jgi:hypothetical protein
MSIPLSNRVKHWVLDWVHPRPTHLCVYKGTGLEGAIVTRVVEEVDLSVYDVASAQSSPPYIVTDDMSICGTFVVCRYVGRLMRDYPVHPRNAAYVDASLDLLQRLVLQVDQKTLDDVMDELETHFPDEDSVWLWGFSRATVADTCWKAAFHWILAQRTDCHVDWETRPRLHLWWMQARDLLVDTSESEEEDKDRGE